MRITKELILKSYDFVQNTEKFNPNLVNIELETVETQYTYHCQKPQFDKFEQSSVFMSLNLFFKIKKFGQNLENYNEIVKRLQNTLECDKEQLDEIYNTAVNGYAKYKEEQLKKDPLYYAKIKLFNKDEFTANDLQAMDKLSRNCLEKSKEKQIGLNEIANDAIKSYEDNDYKPEYYDKRAKETAVISTYLAMRHKKDNRSFLDHFKIFSNIRDHFIRKKLETIIFSKSKMNADCLENIYQNYKNGSISRNEITSISAQGIILKNDNSLEEQSENTLETNDFNKSLSDSINSKEKVNNNFHELEENKVIDNPNTTK